MLDARPKAFLYGRADLRHAVERALFFRLVNDAQLQAFFDAIMDGREGTMPEDPWAATLAPFLENPAVTRPQVPGLAAAKLIRNRVGNLLRLGRRSFHTGGLLARPRVLFLAIHPKFVSFMAPIIQSVGMEAAVLIPEDAALEEHLVKENRPFVALRTAFSRTRPPSPVLAHLPELCRIFDSMAVMLDTLRPGVIAVPEGNAPIYEIANRAAQIRGIPTICLQHGAPAYTNPGFRNWSFTDVFVWGERFIEPFARYNPRQHFTITGTPAMLPPRRTIVKNAPIQNVGFFLQKGATVIPHPEWIMLLEFIGWMAATYPDIAVVVRDHPSQGPLTDAELKLVGQHPNLRFMSPGQHSLNDVLSICDVVAAAASTTLLEAVEAGAIPFIFGSSYPRDFPALAEVQAAAFAPDMQTAKAVFAQLMQEPALRANLRMAGENVASSLFAASGRVGARRIAEALKNKISA